VVVLRVVVPVLVRVALAVPTLLVRTSVLAVRVAAPAAVVVRVAVEGPTLLVRTSVPAVRVTAPVVRVAAPVLTDPLLTVLPRTCELPYVPSILLDGRVPVVEVFTRVRLSALMCA
jgi:hypothetical protein